MCTSTWLRDDEGYLLYFNRDERRSRAAARPPSEQCGPSGTRFLAPTDPEAGGTWIGVNEAGLTLALLNHYAAEAARPSAAGAAPTISRGLLVRELLDCPELSSLARRLQGARLERFRPFTLLGLAAGPGGGCRVYTWDGRRLARDPAPRPPISSSSFETSAVLAGRRAQYEALVGDRPAPSTLEAYQRSHQPERGPFSVCMHRPDARTVSLSRVRVGAHDLDFRYGEGPACRAELGPPLRLARRADGRGA